MQGNTDPSYVENHNLTEGDEIVDQYGGVWEITSILESEDIYNVRRVDDGRMGPNDRDAWSGEAVQNMFVYDEAETTDGRGADTVIEHF